MNELKARLHKLVTRNESDGLYTDANLIYDACERIVKLESACMEAVSLLHTLSMGTDGILRNQICSASNILDHVMGRRQSTHGTQIKKDG